MNECIYIMNARRMKKLNQIDVAKHMGISLTTYSYIENKPGYFKTVKLGKILKLVELLEIDLEELLKKGDNNE